MTRMSKLDSMKDRKFVFGSILIVSNMIDTLLDRELKEYGLTAKQWFMTVVIENTFDSPPTIKDVARAMGSSHQNVKQIALKLQKNGLLALEKDKRDARVTRLRLTDQSQAFNESIQSKAAKFTQSLFAGAKAEDMAKTRVVLSAMVSNLIGMDSLISDEEPE